MALKQKTETQSGITIEAAYRRVEEICLRPKLKEVRVTVATYASEAIAKDQADPKPPVFTQEYAIYSESYSELFATEAQDGAGSNAIKAAYLWLKKQPAFTGAIDA
jgi:hypothetical protein